MKSEGKVLEIKKITGGKDPYKLVEDFILSRGCDPELSLKNRTPDTARWMLEINDKMHLELILDNLRSLNDTTVYMGINIATVPLKDVQNFLVTALETADSLIGVKISIVGHFLVLSSAISFNDITISNLDYQYTLLIQQYEWYKDCVLCSLD